MEALKFSCNCLGEICQVTEDTEQYCVSAEVPLSKTRRKIKCSQYPSCKNQVGLDPIENTCICGHNMDPHDELFELYECNAGLYCSGDDHLANRIGIPGDWRCTNYPDAVITLVLEGFSTRDAQESASSLQSVIINYLSVPPHTRVIYQSASYTTLRRLYKVFASYRISPMETAESEAQLQEELVVKIDQFLSAVELELSSNFQRAVIVAGLTIGEEEIYSNPTEPVSEASGTIPTTMILVLGVGFISLFLICFVAFKIRKKMRLKTEICGNNNLVDNQDPNDSPSLEKVNIPTPYEPSSGYNEGEGTTTFGVYQLEQQEGKVGSGLIHHANRNSISVSPVMAGVHGETAAGEFEMTALYVNASDEMTPNREMSFLSSEIKFPSPIEARTPNSMVPSLKVNSASFILASESDMSAIYRRPSNSPYRNTHGETHREPGQDELQVQPSEGKDGSRSNFKSDSGEPSIFNVPEDIK